MRIWLAGVVVTPSYMVLHHDQVDMIFNPTLTPPAFEALPSDGKPKPEHLMPMNQYAAGLATTLSQNWYADIPAQAVLSGAMLKCVSSQVISGKVTAGDDLDSTVIDSGERSGPSSGLQPVQLYIGPA